MRQETKTKAVAPVPDSNILLAHCNLSSLILEMRELNVAKEIVITCAKEGFFQFITFVPGSPFFTVLNFIL